MPSRDSSQEMSSAHTPQNRRGNAEAAARYRAHGINFITKSSLSIGALDGSRQRLLDRSQESRCGDQHEVTARYRRRERVLTLDDSGGGVPMRARTRSPTPALVRQRETSGRNPACVLRTGTA